MEVTLVVDSRVSDKNTRDFEAISNGQRYTTADYDYLGVGTFPTTGMSTCPLVSILFQLQLNLGEILNYS